MKKLILSSTFLLFVLLSFANTGETSNPFEIEETVLVTASDLNSITETATMSMTIPTAPEGVESQEAWCWGFCLWCCRSCITINGTEYCTEWKCCHEVIADVD